jgi:anti-anti-sigma factor
MQTGSNTQATLSRIEPHDQMFVVHKEGPVAVITPKRWAFDTENLPQTKSDLKNLVSTTRISTLFIDLSQIEWLSSAALGLLGSIAQGDLEVRLHNVSDTVRAALQLTGLDLTFES